jgi:membrane protease YdiL (CAAX protease family)
MLSVKPWKPEAVVRLLLSICICVYGGSVVLSILQQGGAKRSAGTIPLMALSLGCLAAALVLVQKRWRFEHLRRRVLLLMVFFYAGIFLGALAQKMSGVSATEGSVGKMIVATLSFQGATLILIGGFLREHQSTWSEAFGFLNQWPRAVLGGMVVALFFLPIGWAVQRSSMELLERIPRHPITIKEQQAVHALRIASSWFDRLALGLAAILLAPVAEEMVFRGILYPVLKQWGFRRLALWSTSLIFAAIHMNLGTFVPLLVFSLILTVLYEKTDNLLAPITAHALFNGMNFMMLYLVEKQLG